MVSTRVQFAADACPKASVYGWAEAVTSLLDYPLSGPVYFRSSGYQRKLPDIVADLKGQIRITLVGFIDSKKGRIRTRFVGVPDAPVTKFILHMQGGKRGLIVNSTNLCKSINRANVKMTGHNGKQYDFRPVLKNDCGKGKKKGKRSKHKR